MLGGKSLYQYGINPILWSDPWGWSGKPANSPSLEKWIEKKGGTAHTEIETRTWVFSDWEDNTVRYSNGYPDFKPYEIQSVNIEGLKGNHGKGLSGDFGRADMAAPQGKANYALNTWHHHENGTTMQEVPKSVHNRFTHRGGVSKTLKGCAGQK